MGINNIANLFQNPVIQRLLSGVNQATQQGKESSSPSSIFDKGCDCGCESDCSSGKCGCEGGCDCCSSKPKVGQKFSMAG